MITSPLVKPVPAKDGETAVPPFFELAADTRVGFLYSASNTTWDRIQ